MPLPFSRTLKERFLSLTVQCCIWSTEQKFKEDLAFVLAIFKIVKVHQVSSLLVMQSKCINIERYKGTPPLRAMQNKMLGGSGLARSPL